MKTRFGILVGGIAVVVALMLATPKETKAAFGGETSPPIGKSCSIQFRRDALGAAASLPIAPTTGSFNGAETSLAGKLKMVSSDWIVLDNQHGNDVWIPRVCVLLIQF
jgi:gas vesicle protein